MAAASKSEPLAYFITFACYATWLHGDERGSVDLAHNQVGTPFLDVDSDRQHAEQGRSKAPPYCLDEPRRKLVLSGILEAASKRQWTLLAVHVRTNHVHVVVQATQSAERVLNDCKAFASKHLNLAFPDEHDRPRWARHGSTRYLWNEQRVEETVDYALNQQAEPLERFPSEPRTQ